VTSQRTQFANDCQGLPRERHDVRCTTQLFLLGALHSRGGNARHGGVEIELRPLGLSQPAPTNERQRRELKRRSGDRRSLVAFDRSWQFADSLRIRHRRHVLHEHRFQRTTEIGRGIPPGCDRVPEDLATPCSTRCAVSIAPRASTRRVV